MLFQGKKITCIITYNDKKYTFELERHRTINDLYNIFTEKVPDNNYPFIIMHCPNKNKNLVEIKNLDTTILSLDKEKTDQISFQFIKSFKCQSCQSNCDNENKYINKYCLECNQFLCSNCSKKKDSKHNKHYLVNIDQNHLKDSIKLWNINLNADLSNQITNYNRQLNFLNGSSDVKTNLWVENIFKKIKYFENILNDIKIKSQELKSIFKESEDMLNNAMSNLTKSEQEIYSDIFSKDKLVNKFFSFNEAEEQIQKLKNNYIEINNVKSKLCTIIDIDNIKKYEEVLFTVPKALDDLTKASFLILEDLKNFEEKNKNTIQRESRGNVRKNTDIFLNNNRIYRSTNDTALSLNRIKSKNLYFYDSDRKKTDLSVKIYSEYNENTSGRNQKLTALNNPKVLSLLESKKKSSEVKLLKSNKMFNGIESSRYTPKKIQLPKIGINEKDKKDDNNLYSQIGIDKKKSMEIHKNSFSTKKK